MEDIINSLKENKDKIDVIIKSLEGEFSLSSRNTILITLFELVDSVSNVEIDIYNYLRKEIQWSVH